MTTEKRLISLSVNGELQAKIVEPRMSLADFLRIELELTGTHVGCESGVCGACTVNINGQTARACTMLAVQVEGDEVTTIEGASESGEFRDLQDAFHTRNALQCGFCTPGMIMQAIDLVTHEDNLDRDKIRQGLEGNLCRCTGYHNIVSAIESAVDKT